MFFTKITWRSKRLTLSGDRIARSKALTDGPQHVTVHGRDEVVFDAAEEFRRLKGNVTGTALNEAMQASPHREIELEPQRMPERVRDVYL
jgi:hypothetical protein